MNLIRRALDYDVAGHLKLLGHWEEKNRRQIHPKR
jgi:hypothetical protein